MKVGLSQVVLIFGLYFEYFKGYVILLKIFRAVAVDNSNQQQRPTVWVCVCDVEDLRTMGIKRWRVKALKKRKWFKITRELKVKHKVSSC